jgi:uncharacterized membrane protein YphA (DoxX/SURF4 family)
MRLARTCSTIVAAVWLVHGLFNKLLAGSARQLTIVQSVPGLGGIVGQWVILAVGTVEVAIAVWVLTRYAPRLCAALQTILLLSMNVIELRFARDLLLWPEGLIPVNLAFLALAWTGASRRESAPLLVRLRRHPLPIDAHFNECLTLTYAVPADVLRPLLAPGLELETWRGYGFVAVALVDTSSLRPAGLPRWLGRRFFLAGYRVFVTMRTPDGVSRRGLRIVRSDTNRALMRIGGNLLTHYDYRTCDARVFSSADRLDVTVRTRDRGGDLELSAQLDERTLPAGSPFPSLREARRFAGPLPFTFDYEPETHTIVAIKAVRTNWHPEPVHVAVRRLSFFDQDVFRGCTPILAAAFHLRDIDYRWERGVTLPLDSDRGAA